MYPYTGGQHPQAPIPTASGSPEKYPRYKPQKPNVGRPGPSQATGPTKRRGSSPPPVGRSQGLLPYTSMGEVTTPVSPLESEFGDVGVAAAMGRYPGVGQPKIRRRTDGYSA